MVGESQQGARAAFNKAVDLLKSNAFEDVDRFLAQALEQHPNDPNLLRLSGLSLTRQRRLEDAEKTLVHATRLVPDFALAYENLAEAQLLQGKIEDAIKSLNVSLSHNPASTGANRRLGQLLAMVGRGGEADELFQESLEHNPERKSLVEAMEFNRQGNFAQAEKIYRDMLRRDPNNVDALRLMGVMCVKQERYNDSEAFFRKAVDIAPDFWLAWVNLGTAYNEQQKFVDAEQAYKTALSIKSGSVHVLEKLGTNAMNDGRLGEAVSWLEQALDRDQAHFPSLLCLGHALKTIGKQEEAIDAYRRCADAKPDFGEVYWSLANLKTFRFEDAEVEQMEKQIEDLPPGPDSEDSEISFSFALAKSYEDRKNFPKAFSFYSRGNEKKRAKVNYDPAEFQRTNNRLINVFTKEYFEQHEGQGHDDASPILIVGLPRSGSTLLEQILASHSQVEGTAELHYLLRIATATGLNRADGIKYPEYMLELEPHQIKGLGEEYIEQTLAHRTGATYFTDKLPNNFTGIGFLHTILPNAKVIDARRHPLDSCLGTFKQLFARGQVFSYDLYDLAHYYAQYIRIMNHWDEVLPGKVLTVNYENVVDDLETQARRIADHCGLEWEDQMLRFHETKRAVKTASSEQVRQPIYKGALHMWRNYEEQLEELIDYLEPVLKDLPKEQQPQSMQL